MKTFKQFTVESALERKIKKSDGSVPIDIPGTKVLHHDPENNITIYHAHTPEAVCKLSSGLGRCTSGKHGIETSKVYLNKGNMFFVHDKRSRLQVHIRHKEPDNSNVKKRDFDEIDGTEHYHGISINRSGHDPVTDRDVVDKINGRVWNKIEKRIGKEAVSKMRNEPHHIDS